MTNPQDSIGAKPLLQSILDSSFDGIMAFKSIRNADKEIVDFEWVFVNDVAEKIVELSSDELIGKRLLELMPGNKEAGLFDQYKNVAETGQFVTIEQFYPGEEINKWFKIFAVKLDDGVTVTFQDITPLKSAESEAAAREKRYQRLFEGSIDPIVTVNKAGNIIDFNTSLIDLLGYQDHELTKLKAKDLFHSETHYQNYWQLLNTQQKVEEVELKMLTKDNNVISCMIAGVNIPAEHEDGTVFLNVIRDITKRKQVERELRIAEKLSMTGKIARTIAHEVRNPLTNLTLALDQLKDEVKDLAEDSDLYFDIIQRNADRIGKLISDLLNSSKPKELQLVEQSLENVVKSTLNLVRDRIKLKNMVLEEHYESEVPNIPIDKEQLQVAILNLLVNALEAMKSDQGKLIVSLYQKQDKILLSIKDNGPGIPEEKLDNLFEPFFTAKKEGTGLGLTAVQNIVHSHKAAIDVNSEVGVGTEFIIIFRN